jgi:hypothetical protein
VPTRTLLLAFAHGFAEHEKGLFFLPQLVLAPFVLIQMKQLIVSLGKLGVVDSSVADLLTKRITTRAADETLAPVPESTPTPTPESTPA